MLGMAGPSVSFVEVAEVDGSSVWSERVDPVGPRGATFPVGLVVGEDADGELLLGVWLGEPDAWTAPLGLRPRPRSAQSAAAAQLREYLAGERTEFDLRVHAQGSAFEREAWRALTQIPHGQTRSYAAQATLMGRPSAARAVGRANGRNPLPIVVPCHRVIGSDGSLTGFAGGLELKRWLLAHESAGGGVRLPSARDLASATPAPQLGLFC